MSCIFLSWYRYQTHFLLLRSTVTDYTIFFSGMTSAPRNTIIRQNQQGTRGRKVNLISNNFRVNFSKPSLKIYQFDLSIVDPNKKNAENANSVPSKFVCEEVFKQLELGAMWAYDGKKNLYSPSEQRRNDSR